MALLSALGGWKQRPPNVALAARVYSASGMGLRRERIVLNRCSRGEEKRIYEQTRNTSDVLPNAESLRQ
jgi:hypothetical protein